MRSQRDVSRMRGRGVWRLATATVGAFLLIGGAAASARADSDFERGFEDQMGRLLAYEAVSLGKHILFQGVVQPYAVVQPVAVQPVVVPLGYAYPPVRYAVPYVPVKHHGTFAHRDPGPRHDHWNGHDDSRRRGDRHHRDRDRHGRRFH